MIVKKVPGAGRVLMVYDKKDRLVMTQDSVMRTATVKKWMYTLYDDLNRPTTTGLITDNTNYNNASYHWLRADTSIAYPNPAGYTNEELTKTFYDNYDWLAANGNPFPSVRNTDYDVHFFAASNTTYPYPQPLTQSYDTKGLVTGTKTRILNTSGFLYSISYYGSKGEMIQSQSTNITGGTDILTNQYSFSGLLLRSYLHNQKLGSSPSAHYIITNYAYDDLQRITSVKKTLSSNINGVIVNKPETEISRNEYDALGQLKKKKLAPGYNSGAGLDSLTYDYNIRGWMLGANRTYAKDTTSTSNYFGFDLGYDKDTIRINTLNKLYAAKQYNGNITGMLWKSTGDDQTRKYDFTYDPVNRLINADFNQLTNTNFSKAAGIDFSVKNMSYDANGNILTMNQLGWKLGGSQTVDSLLYTYFANAQ